MLTITGLFIARTLPSIMRIGDKTVLVSVDTLFLHMRYDYGNRRIVVIVAVQHKGDICAITVGAMLVFGDNTYALSDIRKLEGQRVSTVQGLDKDRFLIDFQGQFSSLGEPEGGDGCVVQVLENGLQNLQARRSSFINTIVVNDLKQLFGCDPYELRVGIAPRVMEPIGKIGSIIVVHSLHSSRAVITIFWMQSRVRNIVLGGMYLKPLNSEDRSVIGAIDGDGYVLSRPGAMIVRYADGEGLGDRLILT